MSGRARLSAAVATLAAPTVAVADGQALLVAGTQILSVGLVVALALVVARTRETFLLTIVIAAGACFLGVAIADHLPRPGLAALVASGFLPPLAAGAGHMAWDRRSRRSMSHRHP